VSNLGLLRLTIQPKPFHDNSIIPAAPTMSPLDHLRRPEIAGRARLGLAPAHPPAPGDAEPYQKSMSEVLLGSPP
jgi:hypothetical protein